MRPRTRSLIVISIIAVTLLLAAGLAITAAPEWETYHRDVVRKGVNDPTGQNPAAIGLIWTFPRMDSAIKLPGNTTTVDISDDTEGVDWVLDSDAAWENPTTLGVNYSHDFFGSQYGGLGKWGFRWAKAVGPTPTHYARWYFPDSLKTGSYTVQAWFPSTLDKNPNDSDPPKYANVKDAKYSICVYGGGPTMVSDTVTVDQTYGGYWRTLGTYNFTQYTTGNRDYVELTNAGTKSADTQVIVCADAIRFVPNTGIEVYSSPASGTITGVDSGSTPVPAVWIAATEGGVASRSALADTGALYCVRSYQGLSWAGATDFDNKAQWDWDPITNANLDVAKVGTAAWRYPAGGFFEHYYDSATTTYRERTPDERDPVEGPLGRIGAYGGIYSSPTLVDVAGVTGVVFGGTDGQVYCVNAATGKLIWKGPGVTIPEEATGWTTKTGRYDAFGGNFSYATTNSSVADIVYDIGGTDSDPGDDAKKGSDGHAYAIYAWMPAMDAGDSPRTSDAAYTVTFWGGRTRTVRVDQSSTNNLEDKNIGKWVRIGGSFWNPSSVALSVDSKAGNAGSTVVVADAIMVVPAELSTFMYSTAVYYGTTVDDTTIYIGNSNGRVYALSFKPRSATEFTTNLKWTCPKVQTENPITDPKDPVKAGATSFGNIVSSPALYSSTTLVVPSTDGKVYGIDKTNGDVTWTYKPNPIAGSDPSLPTDPDTEAFTSSASINDTAGRAYVPSTGGRIHSIMLDDTPSTKGTIGAEWVALNDQSMEASNAPFSPFRVSTPATLDVGPNGAGIICGSSGGAVQKVLASPSNNKYVDDSFIQPNFYAPIHGSVAIDKNNIYVGTMGTGDSDSSDGGFWWIDRVTGLPLAPDGVTTIQYNGYNGMGQVFSSPALANKYIYVGCSKGRLCAFSAEAFGGKWVGGGFDGRYEQPFSKVESPNPSGSTQVDVFSPTIWEATKKFAETNVATLDQSDFASVFTGANLFADSGCDISLGTDDSRQSAHKRAYGTTGPKGTREMYYEWGESVYLIAWDLPSIDEIAPATGVASTSADGSSKRNSVTFRFNNASPGSGSGGAIDPKKADFIYQYKAKDKDGKDVLRCFAGAKLDIKSDKPKPPSPGPGWMITVEVSMHSSNSGKTSRTAYVPLLQGTQGSWTLSLKDFKTPKTTVKVWQEQPIGFNNPLAICDEGIYPSYNPKTLAMPFGVAWPTGSNGVYQPNRGDAAAHYNGNAIVSGGKFQELMPNVYLAYGPHGANSRIGKIGVMDRSAMGLPVKDPSAMGLPPFSSMIKSFKIQTGDLHLTWGNDEFAKWMLPWDVPPYIQIGAFYSRNQTDYPDISRRDARLQKASDGTDPSVERTTLQPAVGNTDYDHCNLVADPVDVWVEIPKYQPASWCQLATQSKDNAAGYDSYVITYIDSNNDGVFQSGNNYLGKPGVNVETYRKLRVGVDVPPDYRMVVDQPLSIDITGADRALAPHGLGLGVLNTDLTDWFKPFTVQNQGNVNLKNIKIAKYLMDTSHPMQLFADNVDPMFPISTGSGLGIVSSFDGWDPTPGVGNAVAGEPYITAGTGPYGVPYGYTLSKSRVGDVAPMELTLPDTRKVERVLANKPWTGITIKPSVSVNVPLTQPSGSYHAYVPVFADMYGAPYNLDILEIGKEPYADPSFKLNVSVAEDRLTGGTTRGSAIQIDPNAIAGQPTTIYGDTQPAAWRDSAGNVHLFWSSNRPGTVTDPWLLRQADLTYDPTLTVPKEYRWQLNPVSGGAPTWWTMNSALPTPQWPVTTPPVTPSTIKHSAPFAAQVPGSDKVWLFWQGQADKLVGSTYDREYRIFYAEATNGNIGGTIYSFARDLSLYKMNPKAMVYTSGGKTNAWLLWNGGDSGRWSIYGNLNITSGNALDDLNWSPDVKFQTPSALVSVAEPMPIQRVIDGSNAYLDVAFSGSSKYDQASDIIMTRNKWSGTFGSPVVDFVAFPRVINEEILKDNKLNIFTSEHLAWMRPSDQAVPDDFGNTLTNQPFIKVKFPDGTIISATDNVIPVLDRATGIYTYTYTPGTTQESKLGQMLVDFSGGIVRFTKQLPLTAKVYADYTPQAKRLTRGSEQDSAPYIFIEKTPMWYLKNSACANPGLQPQSASGAPVDRMWFFWRKPSTSGALSSTIYYKSYRVTLNLNKPVALSVGTDFNNPRYGIPTKEVIVRGPNGQPITCEVSWDGTKLYLPASAEYYPALLADPATARSFTVTYTAKGDTSTTTVKFDTATWQVEFPETALPTRQSVNEGQICAFADPGAASSTGDVSTTKIWVFWSSTRSGESDLFYQTISPNRVQY